MEALDLQGLLSGGDSWTRTNDPIDVNDVLSLCSMFAAKVQDLVVLDHENLLNSTRVGWLDR